MTDVLIVQGNALRCPLEDNSVHCAILSPPYLGLRWYAGAQYTIWSDNDCEHDWETFLRKAQTGGKSKKQMSNKGVTGEGWVAGHKICRKCGALACPLGWEPTVKQYVNNIVAIFHEIRRVLRPDGTAWLVIADSYAKKADGNGIKPTDLMMVPAEVAIALRNDGWWLRDDIIWHKKNPMPYSGGRRPTTAHEFVFLMGNSKDYYYDGYAIAEPATYAMDNRGARGDARRGTNMNSMSGATGPMRNKRDVWSISSQPTQDKVHFAKYPEKLIKPCILAGTSERGVCPECGTPWKRIIETEHVPAHGGNRTIAGVLGSSPSSVFRTGLQPVEKSVGWEPTCNCGITEVVPATVFDPFLGSGTTLITARRLGRSGVGVELSYEYTQVARERLMEKKRSAWEKGESIVDSSDVTDLPLFGGEES